MLSKLLQFFSASKDTTPRTKPTGQNLQMTKVEIPESDEAIRMPKMMDDMKSGIISKWHVKLGDIVKEGDIIADVETDKATMELENYEEGTVTYINPKKEVLVNDVIMIINPTNPKRKNIFEHKDLTITEIDIPEGSIAVRLPMMFDNMKMAHVTELFTEVGKEVKKGDILAEIETEIGVMELESYDDGIITYINPKKELLVNEIIMTGKGLNTNPTKPKTSENIANDSLEIRNVEVPKNGKAVIMPKMIDSMKSAIISKWHVKLGDIVKEGDILADVETDKATMELECYDNGIVTYINPKKEILVNDTIMVIGSHDSVEEKEEDLVKVPSLGRDINTVTISKWLVEIGDHVKVDDPLVEVESDKATFELVAERDGIIKSITNDVEVKVGDTILKYS
ncbi:biotin/lipoyl-containing protein [Flammeovirga sp. EKP202]|uniref:biotin/lipoyl-containing protein n=1 Tax=Flammeovirga sp. EKP202 TaxID=2770592 RepID=UPI00165EE5CF|nr:hypothetical protein [Flammeovirga sp. EKP202]